MIRIKLPCRLRKHAAFSLLEILIALAILTVGLLSLLNILQRALIASEPVEFETRAALIAQAMLEGIRSDPTGFPFIPGLNPGSWPVVQEDGDGSTNSIYSNSDLLLLDENGNAFDLRRKDSQKHRMNLPLVFSIPGNGVDDDALESSNRSRVGSPNGPFIDREPPPDGDGIDDVMFNRLARRGGGGGPRFVPGITSKRDFDGGIEEDVSRLFLNQPDAPQRLDGRDTDDDGLIDDTGDSGSNLSSLNAILRGGLRLVPDGDFSYDPQRGIDEEMADGFDNDGDGLTDEDLSLPSQRAITTRGGGLSPDNPYNLRPLLAGDGIDNDRDGAIDEEVWDGGDNDDDGLIDEDCQGAVMPWRPVPLPSPNELYSFQISVRRVPVAGDGIDTDGDASLRRGIPNFDDNLNGIIDDPPGSASPELAIDEEFFNNLDDDNDGFVDEDVRAYPARNALFVTITIYQGGDRQDNDGDGWIDEEADDGIDNDRDGLVDEDTYKREFRTTSLVRLPEESV